MKKYILHTLQELNFKIRIEYRNIVTRFRNAGFEILKKEFLKYLRYITIVMSLLLLSQCTANNQRTLKRSVNNKLFDISRDRRMPLYNQKYIELAKKNVLRDEYGYISDEQIKFEEGQNLPEHNKDIYRRLIEEDIKGKKIKLNNDEYPSLSQTNEKINKEDSNNIAKLKEELKNAKYSLKKVQNELEDYKKSKQCNTCGSLISNLDDKKEEDKNSNNEESNVKYVDNVSHQTLAKSESTNNNSKKKIEKNDEWNSLTNDEIDSKEKNKIKEVDQPKVKKTNRQNSNFNEDTEEPSSTIISPTLHNL